MNLQFYCPECKNKLSVINEKLYCDNCSKEYIQSNNCATFIEDSFSVKTAINELIK